MKTETPTQKIIIEIVRFFNSPKPITIQIEDGPCIQGAAVGMDKSVDVASTYEWFMESQTKQLEPFVTALISKGTPFVTQTLIYEQPFRREWTIQPSN